MGVQIVARVQISTTEHITVRGYDGRLYTVPVTDAQKTSNVPLDQLLEHFVQQSQGIPSAAKPKKVRDTD